MKKTKLTFLLALLLISCSENEMKDNGLNNEDTIIVDQEDLAIVGQWMLSSSSGRLTDASTTSKSFEEVCNIDSIIFQEDNSFKIYTNDEDGISNYVIFGNYSIDTENIITLTVVYTTDDGSGNSTEVTEVIGTISDLEVDETSLSGSLDIEGLCVNLQEGYKESSYVEGLTYIPDGNLENWLVNEGWDSEIDGYITTSSAQNLPIVAIYATDNGYDSNGDWCQCYGDDRFSERLTSLAGIEAFPNIEILTLVGNKLDSINISQNDKLKYLYLDFNTLSKLNTSNNPLLQEIALDNNEVMIEVDFNNNPNLKKLALPNVGIENLDLSNNNEIEFLDVPNNELDSINITNLTRTINQSTPYDS